MRHADLFKGLAGLSCLGMSLAFMACSPTDVQNGVKVDSDAVIAQYRAIGEEHNNTLARYYAQRSEAKRAAFNEMDYLNNFFGIDEKTKIIVRPSSSVRGTDDVIGLVAEMVSEELVDSRAATYMKQVEQVLNDPLMSVGEMQSAITEIERQVIPVLKDELLDQFMAYAETAKSSLTFWDENYNVLVDAGNATRGALKRLAMMAASDAAGAAAGAVAGAAMGGAPGAAIGAAICGAVSSAMGAATEKFCVVVNLGQIQDAINAAKKK